jgi:hypothetical protein
MSPNLILTQPYGLWKRNYSPTPSKIREIKGYWVASEKFCFLDRDSFIYSSTQLFIYTLTQKSTLPPTHSLIHSSINPTIHPFTLHPSIHMSIHLPHLPIHPSLYPFTHTYPPIYPPITLPIHSSIYPPTYPPIHFLIHPTNLPNPPIHPAWDLAETTEGCSFKVRGAEPQWLTPVFPATLEAEIRRITVQSQPPANNLWDPISKTKQINKQKNHKKGLAEWLKW